MDQLLNFANKYAAYLLGGLICLILLWYFLRNKEDI